MEFFNPNSKVNFMGIRRFTVAVFVAMLLASLVLLGTRGLNFALDFTGGTLVEVAFEEPTEQSAVTAALDAAGYRGAIVQRFDSRNFSIRLAPEVDGKSVAAKEEVGSLDDRNTRVAESVLRALGATGGKPSIKRSEYVGPQVGDELFYNGIVAVAVVLTGIFIYIMMRFEWKFSAALVGSELCDVIVLLGFCSLTGMDFDLTVLAAVLAVDGYSVNDKIVVFDRVRELFRSSRKASPAEILNIAVNQTLSRTIMTSVTTLLTVVALYLFGGPTVEGFSLALIVGITLGTFSSIFFACPLLLALGVNKQDLMPKARDESDLDRRP